MASTPRHSGIGLLRGCGFASAVAIAAFAPPLVGQDPGSPDPAVGDEAMATPTVMSIDEAPEIDGVLEEIWDAGTLLPDTWRQVDPDEGAPPTQRTEVRLMRDRRNLYVAIRCFDDEPDRIIARAQQRDSAIRDDDNVKVVLDPKRDRRTGYVFIMNALGARGDARLVNGRTDRDWDAVWEGRSSIDDEGWTAEFVIPFRTISIDPAAREWGINVERTIRRNNERVRLVSADRDIDFDSVADAAVVGMFGDIDQGAGVDVKPYGKFTWEEGEDSSARTDAGVDVFWKITPSLTFVGTINPDFAETEVDQRVINFSRFSLRFPEKRDFFLEDAGYFNFGGIGSTPAPFYSRRIGLSPQGEPERILGGLKLTGSVGDVSVGILDTMMSKGVEPADRNYFAGRVLVNVLEQSSVGLVATAGNPLDGRSNQLVGADFNYVTSDLDGGKTFKASAFFQQTVTEGVGGIGSTAAGVKLSYPNDDWRAFFGWFVIGPDYFPALGFANRIGVHEFFGGLTRRWRPEVDLIRTVSVGANGYWIPDLDFETESLEIEFDVPRIQFERGDIAYLELGINQEVPTDDFLVAGELLVPAGDYTWAQIDAGFETTSKDPFILGVNGGWSGYYGGTRLETGVEATWQPAPSLLLGGSLQWNDITLDTGNLETWLASARANIYFSPQVSWENLAQYDTQSGTVGLNSRFRWAFRDGQEIFLVFNQNVEADDLEFTIARTEIVTKIGWTFSF
ncbi:MAG: carbohydrate binding family 9 domain-containing protein [Phycisphaera sp.]|nr:carbohydrate binding family 9 domain-containing protein [Phycisphaera sp.]